MHKKAPCLSPYHVRKHLRIDIPVICMPARRCCQVGQAYKCLVFSMFLLGVEVLQPKPRAASAQSWQDPCGTVIYLYLTEKIGKRTNMLCLRWTSSEHRLPRVWEAQLQGLNILATECYRKLKSEWRDKRHPRASLEPDQPARHTERIKPSQAARIHRSWMFAVVNAEGGTSWIRATTQNMPQSSRPAHRNLPRYSWLDYTSITWLVVSTPLWKISVSWDYYSQYIEK